MPHTDVGSPVWEEGRRKSPVAADAPEMHSAGVYHLWCGHSVVDVINPAQFLRVEVVPRVRWSARWGSHDFPVPARKGVGRCVHVCRIRPRLRGCQIGMCSSGGVAVSGIPEPRPSINGLIGGGRGVAWVIVCLDQR